MAAPTAKERAYRIRYISFGGISDEIQASLEGLKYIDREILETQYDFDEYNTDGRLEFLNEVRSEYIKITTNLSTNASTNLSTNK